MTEFERLRRAVYTWMSMLTLGIVLWVLLVTSVLFRAAAKIETVERHHLLAWFYVLNLRDLMQQAGMHTPPTPPGLQENQPQEKE